MQTWIILQGPAGIRKVAENTPYRLAKGEMIVGSESEENRNEQDLAILASEHGIAWGDMIAAATKALGIKPCKSCEQRRLILNRVSELGVDKAFELIRDTFRKGEIHGIE